MAALLDVSTLELLLAVVIAVVVVVVVVVVVAAQQLQFKRILNGGQQRLQFLRHDAPCELQRQLAGLAVEGWRREGGP